MVRQNLDIFVLLEVSDAIIILLLLSQVNRANFSLKITHRFCPTISGRSRLSSERVVCTYVKTARAEIFPFPNTYAAFPLVVQQHMADRGVECSRRQQSSRITPEVLDDVFQIHAVAFTQKLERIGNFAQLTSFSIHS